MPKGRNYLGNCLLALFVCLALLGCEKKTDEDSSGTDSYFKQNAYKSTERDALIPAELEITPAAAALSIVGQTVVFTVNGGYGGYHWRLANEANGQIRSQGANQAIYTCVRVGNNDVIVQDDEGHYVVARITPVVNTMTVSPGLVELIGTSHYASFSVSGGTPPYSWLSGNPALGTVSYSASSSHLAGYTAVIGAYGENVITVIDAEGRTASAMVKQKG